MPAENLVCIFLFAWGPLWPPLVGAGRPNRHNEYHDVLAGFAVHRGRLGQSLAEFQEFALASILHVFHILDSHFVRVLYHGLLRVSGILSDFECAIWDACVLEK